MAFEAKIALLNEMEHSLEGIMSAAQLKETMAALADAVAEYSVEKTEDDDGNDDLLGAYLDALSVEGRSAKTIERYRYIITRMMEAVKTSTRRITVYHLRRYLADEKARGISDRTLDGVRQVFSAYFGWLQRERLIETNPTSNLGAIKCQKKVKIIYSDVDLEKMKMCCRTARDRAIISFLMSTGCRISEMTQLNRDDVDLVNLECTVLGKGNKERTVFLDAVTAMHLREYLRQRKDMIPALFIGKRSERLTPHGVRYMLTQLQDVAQVEHVHPHKFRRTLATNLIRHGMPIQEVAAILGHNKLDTTMEYVVLDKTDVKNAYRKYA